MNPLFGLFEGAVSPSHILVVLVVGFLLFGKRLPELGRSLGQGIMAFKKGLHGLEDELEGAAAPPRPVSQPAQSPQRIATAPPGSQAPGSTVSPPRN